MTYLLIVVIVLWTGTWYFYKQTDTSGDNFGAVFPFLAFGVLACFCSVVYLALVFWNHRFL